MIWLLDTNACIRLLNRRSSELAENFSRRSARQIRLCPIVKFELLYGAHKSQRPLENQKKLERFFAPLKSLPFDDRCAERAGLLRVSLEKAGRSIGGMDLLIAATALAYEVVLVTANVDEFSRVPELRWENWEAQGP